MTLVNLSKTDIRVITKLAHKQLRLEREYQALEERVKAKRRAYDEVANRALPDALAEAGVESLTLRDGAKVTIKANYYCSLTGKYREPALSWLRKQGLDDLISQVIGIHFGKGEDKKADRLRKILAKAKVPFRMEEVINSGSFKALVRELIERGEKVPHAKLGIQIIEMAKITLPKTKKRSSF